MEAQLTQQDSSDYAIRQGEQATAADSEAVVGRGVNPPMLFSGALISGLLLNRLFPLPFLPRWLGRMLGTILVISGPLLGAASVQALRHAGNSPKPDIPVRELVTTGPYRYTRNPIYIAMAMLYSGIAALGNARWAILLLPAVLVAINERMVGREESYLEQRFGRRYYEYKACVRRWL
jgi:protein-S-isoprenylcysteine O-methyltransferase Ste14